MVIALIDEYFGIKELYEVVIKAKTPMTLGSRHLESGEPVLYFNNIKMAVLNQRATPIMARGGWGNMPRVIWEDRSEVQFTLSEGVLSSISFNMLLSAQMAERGQDNVLYVQKVDGPRALETVGNYESVFALKHWPTSNRQKKVFIYDYERDVAQKKMYGRYITGIHDPFDENVDLPYVQVFEDKACTILADPLKNYIVDYYYDYTDEALIYTIQKERFNGAFILEGKFYSKDENDGINYTNLLYMPSVRIVSDINLRLGERADPAVAVFNIFAMPENLEGSKNNVIMEITHLDHNIDDDI